jgi:hypothetical protein
MSPQITFLLILVFPTIAGAEEGYALPEPIDIQPPPSTDCCHSYVGLLQYPPLAAVWVIEGCVLKARFVIVAEIEPVFKGEISIKAVFE